MPAGAAAPHSHALAVAALISWLVTAGIGAYMLRALIAHGGWRRQRASKDGLPPGFLLGHFSLALTGLALWISYVAAGQPVLAWLAVALLAPAIGLGISTVTLWTPFPDPQGAGGTGQSGPARAAFPSGMLAPPAEDALARRLTDDVLAKAVTNEVLMSKLVDEVVASARADPLRPTRRPKGHMAALVPVGHGIGAMATFVLAVIAAVLGSLPGSCPDPQRAVRAPPAG